MLQVKLFLLKCLLALLPDLLQLEEEAMLTSPADSSSETREEFENGEPLTAHSDRRLRHTNLCRFILSSLYVTYALHISQMNFLPLVLHCLWCRSMFT